MIQAVLKDWRMVEVMRDDMSDEEVITSCIAGNLDSFKVIYDHGGQ